MKKISIAITFITAALFVLPALAQPGLPPEPQVYVPALFGNPASVPTATLIPPTATPTLVPTATNTPVPPTPTSTGTSEPTATATNTPVPGSGLIMLSSWGEQVGSTYWVYVEMKNVSDTANCFVDLAAKLYRADGSWFLANGQLLLPRVAPGQVVPGRLYASANSGEVVSYALVGVIPDDCMDDLFYYEDLDVVSAYYRYVNYLGTEYYGEIRNSSGKSLSTVYIATTVYWPSGYIRCALGDFPDGGIGMADGELRTFSTQSYHDFTGAPAGVQAQGYGY